MKKLRQGSGAAVLVLVLSVLVVLLGVFAVKAPTPIVLLAAGAAASLILVCTGVKYADIEAEMVRSASRMLLPVVRLMAVGVLVGTWIASGTVPYMIYVGMRLLSPRLFLPAVCLLCALMSAVTGTSWGTVATVGVACMSVGVGIGLPPALAAGAIVTGAMFGDKASPLSDSVMLTSSLTGVAVTDGIRHLLRSTGPAFLASLLFFLVSGLRAGGGAIGSESYRLILEAISGQFRLSPLLLLPPVLLFALILLKKPMLPAFAAGIVSAAALALLFQGETAADLARSMYSGYHYETTHELLVQLLNRGGLTSMLPTIALLFSACIFGAPINASGVLELLLEWVKRRARSPGALANGVLALHALFFSVTGSYYVSVPVVASMTGELFPACGLDRKNLMRILQDTGTGLSALIPWAATGVYITGMLGLESTLVYLPYAPMLWLSILISLFMGFTGAGLAKRGGVNEGRAG